MDLDNLKRQDIEEIITVTNKIIKISQGTADNPSPQKEGGYLTLAFNNFTNGKIIPVGNYPKKSERKYWEFSQEKAHRLYIDFLRNPTTTISSYQTRNPDEGKWGGAVLFKDIVGTTKSLVNLVSFSGLPELCDEALSAILGNYLGLTKRDKDLFENIIKLSSNKFLYPMLEEFKKIQK